MRSLFLASGLVASMLSAATAEDVVTITDASLASAIADNQFVLMEFYAPWCGHCKSLAPEYEKAATQLKNDEQTSKVVLGKVDATVETKAAEKFQIQGFPTLKWFVNGVATEYGGGRTADAIVSWIKKKTGPATTKINSVADLDKFKADPNVVVVLVAGEENKAFESAAQTQEIPFGVVINPSADLKKALGVDSLNQIVVFKKFDDKRAAKSVNPADLTSEEVVEFVSGHMLPLIVPFSQETAQKIFGGSIKQHFILFTDKTNTAQHDDVLAKAQSVAEEQRGKYLFVTVDKADERVLEFFGITAKDLPTGRVVQLMESGMKKFRLTGDVTTENIRNTVEKHAKGELSMDLKSEPVPEKNDGDVKVLVGKNFNDIVKQPGKDVFIEFYAPWCGHCKSLAPKWEDLGKWAKNKPNLVIAKMDATANDVDVVQISGFPTLKLFKADSEEIVDYDDARELDNMIAFLEKNAPSAKVESS